uniref:Ig-like domain-containing protein n=1 Tax=Lates calcarifer TaxID=8187 RepID=A0A4W6BPI1_LATCA
EKSYLSLTGFVFNYFLFSSPSSGSVSAPVISGINLNSSTVVLECESKGWYPEPEVLWLDGEGNLLSAGPTETVRGPDDLYTVSSRVTVRRGNSFICRVEQKIINQTSETKIQISGTISINLSINTEKEHETRSTYPQNGSVSAPVISGINLNSSTVVLECKSKGWYPEPEVLWLDGEGNLLSAGPTETVRGPDDLYTVSSRVTVRRGNNFICRVEQKIINQTSETKIQISGTISINLSINTEKEHETRSTYLQNVSDCSTSCYYSLIFNGVTAFLCVVCLGCVLFVCKKSSILLDICSARRKDLVQKETQLQKQSEKMKEEQDVWTKAIAPMEELTGGLKNQRQELRLQLEEVERDMKENREKVQSVETEIAESDTDSREGHLQEKQNLLNVQGILEKGKEKLEKLDLNVEKLMQTAEGIMATMTGRRQKVQNSMEVINMQLEEVESQRDTVHLHKE